MPINIGLVVLMINLAMINTIKPQEGIGEGVTEYFYNIYSQFMGFGLNPELVYSRATRNLNYDYGRFLSRIINKFIFVYDYRNISSELKGMKSGYDIAHVASQELGFAAKQIKRRGISKHVITTIHDLILLGNEDYLSSYGKFLRATYYNIVKASIYDAVDYSDFIIFDSSLAKDKFVARYGKRESSAIVNLGVQEKFLEEKTIKKNSKEFIVGYIGALEPKKNVIDLLRCAKELKNENSIKFLIYGKGMLFEELFRFKNRNKLENVTFMGFAPVEKIVDIYDSFDVFVFPSLNEGFGLPILEAQARGIPVIILKKAAIPEEVGRYCIKADDEKDMAIKINTLRNNGYADEKLATKYARSFTWKKCAEQTYEIYSKLV